jgi:hypothetical protein
VTDLSNRTRELVRIVSSKNSMADPHVPVRTMSIEMNRRAFLRAFHDLQLPTAIQHKAISAKRSYRKVRDREIGSCRKH